MCAAAFRRAGFARVEQASHLCSSLPVRSEHIFTRNGFAVIYTGGSYEVRVQSTGELLAELPDRPKIAISFVLWFEVRLDLLRAPRLHPQQQVMLDDHARKLVDDAMHDAEDKLGRYQAWKAKKSAAGSDPV